jgi:TRAP-type C4-dicarboxylate transport system permease small subunit
MKGRKDFFPAFPKEGCITRMLKLLDKTLNYIVGTLMILMALTVLAQIVFRSIFNISLSWSTEFSTFLFSWIVFLGAAVGFRRCAHFSVDFLINLCPPAVRRFSDLLVKLIVSAFFTSLIYYGIELVDMTKYQVSPALEISMGMMYAVIPLGSAIMLIYLWATSKQQEGN